MAFKAVFLAHAPDADAEKHKCIIDTGKYKLFVVVVKDQDQAVEVCRKLVGMTYHVYMLDENGIMWHHDMKPINQQSPNKNMGKMNAWEDFAEPDGPIVSGRRNDFYLI